MTTIEITGALGCLLTIVFLCICLPIDARVIKSTLYPSRILVARNIIGLFFFACWIIYALMSNELLLAFIFMLFEIKYIAVLAQYYLIKKR